MSTTWQQSFSFEISIGNKKQSFWKKFIAWSDSQEKYRLGWLGAVITLHGCLFTIITMFAVVLSGNHFIFWPFVIGAMGATLVVNLAALPTKITIPVFFASVVIDLMIIAICLTIGFNIGGTII